MPLARTRNGNKQIAYQTGFGSWKPTKLWCPNMIDMIDMIHMILQRGQWRKQVLKIFGPKLIRINLLIKTVRSAVSKNRVERSFFSDFENTKLVARRRTHFQVFPAIFLVAQLCPKTGVLEHKISLASCSGPLLRQRFLRRCEETACNRKKIEINLVFVTIMLRVLTYVVSNKFFCHWHGVVRSVSQEVWFDRGFVL